MAPENHVENPAEYALENFSHNVSAAVHALTPNPARHVGQAVPQVRRITVQDLKDSLRAGVADLGALRDDILFIGLIYPVAGLVLARLAADYALLPMVFPLASGFALLGPVAAIGLYEMSRRRERGEHVTWADGFKVLQSPAIGSILGLGALFLLLFGLWMAAAYELNLALLGPAAPPTIRAFEQNLFWTQAGGTLIAGGIGIGFLFAVAAFAMGVVSFPLMLDRDVDMWVAIGTSVKAVAKNPGIMALWGLIFAGLLVAGSIPALVGLVFVMPVLGHASWHLYRKVVV
ncbi:DUF2189 domain-containing protein [Phenylobacterium sp.]|jgi:uncharacterized membrane protein|uniref:DUF2189 domain-containing protein n=1 Tax=Phenylobacterium sp. TaxID=1871053 RepID=UPI002F3ED6B0